MHQSLHNLQSEHDTHIDEVKELRKKVPYNTIQRERNFDPEAKGGQQTFPPHIWSLILEQLVNRTPPTSINANIVSVVKTFSPSTKILQLPSLTSIRRGRSILLTVVQLIAARKLALSPTWIQCFTDGTTRRQSAKQTSQSPSRMLLVNCCQYCYPHRSFLKLRSQIH